MFLSRRYKNRRILIWTIVGKVLLFSMFSCTCQTLSESLAYFYSTQPKNRVQKPNTNRTDLFVAERETDIIQNQLLRCVLMPSRSAQKSHVPDRVCGRLFIEGELPTPATNGWAMFGGPTVIAALQFIIFLLNKSKSCFFFAVTSAITRLERFINPK